MNFNALDVTSCCSNICLLKWSRITLVFTNVDGRLTGCANRFIGLLLVARLFARSFTADMSRVCCAVLLSLPHPLSSTSAWLLPQRWAFKRPAFPIFHVDTPDFLPAHLFSRTPVHGSVGKANDRPAPPGTARKSCFLRRSSILVFLLSSPPLPALAMDWYSHASIGQRFPSRRPPAAETERARSGEEDPHSHWHPGSQRQTDTRRRTQTPTHRDYRLHRKGLQIETDKRPYLLRNSWTPYVLAPSSRERKSFCVVR